MIKKRFMLVYIDEYDDWRLYDTKEEKWYDIDLTRYQKEMERLERNHQNLHEKYEQLEVKYYKLKAELFKIKGNESSAKQIYKNLKNCFESFEGDAE